jgi:aminoglycoside 6'-N-acetyltransferase I
LATERAFYIEEVRDVRAVWPELERLMVGIIEYHRPWDARELRDDWAPRVREYLDRGPEIVTFLARNQAGRAVGFVSGYLQKDYGIFKEPFSFIDNVFVEEDNRGAGVGTALVERFEAWSKAQGATEVQLHVNAGNSLGQRFWDREGFRPSEYVMRKPVETQP